MNTAQVQEFVALVRDVRNIQRYYRRTLCPIARRELPQLEDRLDREADALAALVGIPEPEPAVAEGGAL